jgi:ankyrin repeat protein
VEVFKVLLDNGLDVNQYLELSGSALVTACQAGNVELVRFLLEKGADPNLGYASGDFEALVWAIIGRSAKLDVVKLLHDHGVVVKGTGALIAAAEHGNLAAVELLLKSADVDLEEVEDYGGYLDKEKEENLGTALYAAAKEGHADIVNVLLEKGANVHFKTQKGRSPADIAEENGHQDIARKLRQVQGK